MLSTRNDNNTPLKTISINSETFVDQQNGYDSRYTFSAKEKDDETQYSYFGARYYESDLSIWLSVDPLAKKYPSMCLYMYCAGNPVVLVDPDGMEIGDFSDEAKAVVNPLIDKKSDKYYRAIAGKFRKLEKSSTVYNLKLVDKSKNGGLGEVSKNEDGSIDVEFSVNKGIKTTPNGGFSKEYSTLFEEVFHAIDYDKGRLDLENPTCKSEARAWKFAANAPGTSLRNKNTYKGVETNDYTFAYSVRKSSVRRLSIWFKNGKDNWLDKKGTNTT